MEKYYHLYTTALKKCQLFRNDSDRIFFLNRLAIYRVEYNVVIYAYCLMDNHIHLLVSGEEESILAFFRQLKTMYGWYLSKSETEVVNVDLTEFKANLRVIKGEEDFKTVVAYILRNPFAAGIDSPYSYNWSSAYLYFNPRVEYFRGIPLKTYGIRKAREILKTRITLPDSYTVFDDMFSPVSWCNFRRVERVFGKSSDFFRLVSKWNLEQDEEAKIEAIEKNTYTDSALLSKITEYCRLQGVDKVEDLTKAELRVLATTSHKRWGASKKQIQRILAPDII